MSLPVNEKTILRQMTFSSFESLGTSPVFEGGQAHIEIPGLF